MHIKNFSIFAITAILLSACGGGDAPPPPAEVSTPKPAASAPVAKPAPAPVSAANAAGEKVFKKVCALCHASGVAGAPIPGHKDDWGPRIAKGKDVLYKHAIEGFTGEKGMMPPRGGGSSLTDEEVKAAVDYMTSK